MAMNPPKTSGFAHAPQDVPQVPHWAILRFSSILVPGDERSRTAPGHGYPERTESTMGYQWFLDEEEFRAAILPELVRGYTTVRGIHVNGHATVRTIVETHTKGD